jgi:hypothetical protein
MALLDTASLIVTPNGYKASKLYSIVPTDGTGDMTFSRTGNTATRVNSSGVIETVNANIPRLDYSDVTCPKLLLEPQRTNVLLNSATLSTQSVTTTAVSYTLSFYGTGTIVLTGAFVRTLTGTGASNRVSTTFTSTAAVLILTVTGSVTNAQLEVGSFATSYIPTTTASVTRNIDNCNKSSATALIGQTEGTLFFDFKVNSQNGTSTYFGITSGSFTNYILIGKESSVTPNKIIFAIRGSGTTVFSDTSTSLNGNFNRCAIAYKSGNYAAYFNGTLVASGTSSITFSASLNLFGFGANSTFTLNEEKLEIKSAAIWNTRLTNSELAQLTTL